jgi:lipoprotein-releasing system permease protein
MRLAAALGVQPGGNVVLIAPQGSMTPAGFAPTMRRFHVSGLFHSGMYEFDSALALAPLADRAHLPHGRWRDRAAPRAEGSAGGPRVVRDLALQIGGGFYVSDWTRDHASFFRSIQTTKTMMFMILLLVVAVAAFNIVATLVMVVKEKRPAIAILRTMGALPRNVLGIFSIQGALIGLAGTLAGALLGWFLSTHIAALVARHRARDRRAVPRCARLLHERAAGLRRVARRAAGVRGGVCAVRAGDAVSCLARRAHAAGRGTAA